MRLDFQEVYAVPGADSIIDGINPDTGLTCVNGSTEAEIHEREPLAVRMTWADWRQEAARRQQTPIVWTPTTQATYHYMLNVLPPALWIGGAFLVGEPDDHDLTTGRPRFVAYLERGDRFFVASRPLTCAELRAVVQS